MGCWMSTVKYKDTGDRNNTFDGSYVAVVSPTHDISKRRLWASRLSLASSSGVSSGCNTPIRKSNKTINRCNISLSEEQTPIKRPIETSLSQHEPTYQNIPGVLKDLPLDIALEEAQTSQERRQLEAIYAILDESGVYNTESSNSECSSPLPSGVIYTQSVSDDLESTASTDYELEMEMRMVGKAYGIMPKTSSPILQRRNLTYDIEAEIGKPLTEGYQKWRTYLQTTPAYALNNVTRIPEAIAGHFCPSDDYPGYSDLKTSKYIRPPYRESMFYEHEQNIVETIILDLPVATMTTEL